MLNSHVGNLVRRNFKIVQQKFANTEVELFRINFNMRWKTKLLLDNYCKRYKIKTSEGIRLLMCTSHETVSKFDIEKVRNDIMLNIEKAKTGESIPGQETPI